MNRTVPRPAAPALVAFVAMCASACAVPLAPGYRIVKQSRQVRFVPGQSPELQINAQYKLQNVGTSDLNFVDMVLPDRETFGRKSVRSEVDGKQTAPASLPEEYQREEPDALRTPLDPPWAPKQTRDLSIEYSFDFPENSGSRITLDENSFHLSSRGWFPQLLPPKHLLSPSPKRPDDSDYTVRVPADFLIVARGDSKGRKKDGDEIEYRYQLRSGDLAPYVVAGRYVAWPPDRRSNSTVFWTMQPLKNDPSPGAGQITAAWLALETAFGPLDKKISAPHIVESPGLRGRVAGESGPAGAAFPGGAIVNPAALALGPNSAQFLDIVAHALARNWFGDEMYPAPAAAVGMGEGLPEYATIVIDEARNGAAARRARIERYLRRYDEARVNADEIPLAQTLATSPISARRIAVAKAPLFYIALEDACGEFEVRRGLADLVSAFKGHEVGYNDLRAALEQSTTRNLANIFRAWLNQNGIPEDFRARYPLGLAGMQTGE